MKPLSMLFLLLLAALSLSACANREKKKSSARLYEGDAPTIKYTTREYAGGPLGGS